ncbi:MAG TPA: pilin [Candidatus Paceibacterota bacterium]|nr:pilin [Candidatus Paceibacterota bacterium]
MKKLRLIIVPILALSGLFGIFNFVQAADTPSVTIQSFDVQPQSIPYSSSSTLNFSFTLSTPTANSIKDYCSREYNFAGGSANWFVEEKNSLRVVANGTIPADDFLTLRVSQSGHFSYTPESNQSTANFQLEIDCHGTISTSRITNSAAVPVSITGQAAGLVKISFGSDKTNQHVQPNSTLPVTFEVDLTSKESDLLNKCSDPAHKLTYVIDEFSLGNPGAKNSIFGNNISFSSFGNGSTVKNSIPLQVNVPGNDIGFVAEARCDGNKVLADSSQLTIYAGGSGTGLGGNGSSSGNGSNGGSTGATAPTNYDFEIKNPLAGGPNTLFDVIDIVTKWLITFSIPLAVLFILYAGFLFLTAGPRPGNVKKAREVLQWTVVGLAIIFIGRGFITLIFSVLNLQNSSAPTIQPNSNPTSQNNADGTLQSAPSLDTTTETENLPSGASNGSLEYQNVLNVSPDGSTNIPVNQYSEIGITVHNPAGPAETFNWSKTSGSLPPGMSVTGQSDAGGQRIAGTPTKKGSYTFTLQAMDIAARQYGTVNVTINVQ